MRQYYLQKFCIFVSKKDDTNNANVFFYGKKNESNPQFILLDFSSLFKKEIEEYCWEKKRK